MMLLFSGSQNLAGSNFPVRELDPFLIHGDTSLACRELAVRR